MKTKKDTINKFDILSTLVFFACVEIPSITRFHGQNYLFLARVFILLFLLVKLLLLFKKSATIIYNNSFFLITIWFLYLILITFINYNDLFYALRIITIPYVMSFYAFIYKKKIVKILHNWCFWLAVLVFIDFISIILFPNGMYNDGLYSLNWFLGYKTARFQIELPLCTISAYLSKIEKGKIKFSSFLYLFISMYCTLVAKTTSAFACLFILLIYFVFLNYSERIDCGKKILKKVFDYKIIILIYILAVLSLYYINDLHIVQNFIQFVFHKDASLTTRTTIWQFMIEKIQEKPFFGFGILNQDAYISITNSPFANSAHSLFLGLLIEGGFVGTFLYFYILKKALDIKCIVYMNERLIIIAGITVGLILGLTSVSLMYSEFSMVMFEILFLNSNYMKGKYEKI